MDAYEPCPTCGKPVQRGRICRYCAQEAGHPQATRRAAASIVGEELHRLDETPGEPGADEAASASISRGLLIAIGLISLAVLVAAVVLWNVL